MTPETGAVAWSVFALGILLSLAAVGHYSDYRRKLQILNYYRLSPARVPALRRHVISMVGYAVFGVACMTVPFVR